jgi:site-specific recombinase XerD
LTQIAEPPVDPKAVSTETVDRLLMAALRTGEIWERVRNTALLYVLRDCGCRVGAVANLDMGNLDLARTSACSPDKNGKLCKMRFCPNTVQAIRDWLSWRSIRKPKDYRVFTGERGKGLSREGIERVLRRLAIAAGVEHERHNPHAFRHAFARDSLLAGADLSRVSQDMGHSSVVVTHKFYARWEDDELLEFHQRFSPGQSLPEIVQK